MAITHISDLTPDKRNARKRTERSAGMIAKSLEKFGAARSVVIDENGQLLAGHGTVEAAAQVGIEKVVVVPVDGNTVVAVQRTNLTPEQKVQYALADNRSSDLSAWDAEVLSELADEHDLQDWFKQDELAGLLDRNDVEPLDDMPDLPSGDREPIQQMTFTLHDQQVEIVKEALDKAKGMGDFVDTNNENSNGNALTRVAELFLSWGGDHGLS